MHIDSNIPREHRRQPALHNKICETQKHLSQWERSAAGKHKNCVTRTPSYTLNNSASRWKRKKCTDPTMCWADQSTNLVPEITNSVWTTHLPSTAIFARVSRCLIRPKEADEVKIARNLPGTQTLNASSCANEVKRSTNEVWAPRNFCELFQSHGSFVYWGS